MYDKYTIANAPAGYYLVHKAGVQPFVLRVERPEKLLYGMAEFTFELIALIGGQQHVETRWP